MPSKQPHDLLRFILFSVSDRDRRKNLHEVHSANDTDTSLPYLIFVGLIQTLVSFSSHVI